MLCAVHLRFLAKLASWELATVRNKDRVGQYFPLDWKG